MNQKALFFLGAGLLLAGFILAVMLYNNQGGPGSVEVPRHGSGAVERAGAAMKGAEDARVTIVEFLDPACGTCAQFYPLVEQLLRQNDGKVRVMIRYAPLHPGSDQVVRMLEAASKQGRFWPALELLFANQRSWVANHRAQPQLARRLLNSIAMDHARFDRDWQGPEVASVVQQDIRDGESLGVRATPEFFVNGRPMPSFGYEQLERLVREALADSY